jgi:hypothetical protein
MTKYFHGTSTESGLDVGDKMDGACGSFESCVWATASIEHARRFARARAALGGDPVVFVVRIDDDATVRTVSDSDDIEADLRAAREGGVDLIEIESGEGGHREVAIIRGVTVVSVA